MTGIGFFVIVLLLGIPLMIIALGQMVSVPNDKKTELIFPLRHIDGIPEINNGIETMVYVYQDRIVFDNKQIIPLSRIKKTEVITEKQMTVKQKSVIANAILGGLILGNLGALLGGMVGVGTKKVQKTVYMFSIDFINKDNEESNALLLIEKYAVDSIKKISDKINSRIGYVPIEPKKSFEI